MALPSHRGPARFRLMTQVTRLPESAGKKRRHEALCHSVTRGGGRRLKSQPLLRIQKAWAGPSPGRHTSRPEAQADAWLTHEGRVTAATETREQDLGPVSLWFSCSREAEPTRGP